MGKPNVEMQILLDEHITILQIVFIINKGELLLLCSNSTIQKWSIQTKKPVLLESLQFQRDKLSYCLLPLDSEWVYIGSQQGNIHVAKLEHLSLSGYIIHWNKLIKVVRRTHPGAIVHLSDNPVEPNTILIGFECGEIVLWDLRTKETLSRFTYSDHWPLRSISWNSDGKEFLASYKDGSIVTWLLQKPEKPDGVMLPHSSTDEEGNPLRCKPVDKVEYKQLSEEPVIIFSGGMSYGKAPQFSCITIQREQGKTVLEMEDRVIDFTTISDQPFNFETQEAHSLAVLLETDLLLIDLQAKGYPCFENPYPMDIHESPITSLQYIADCQPELIPALYQLGFKQKRTKGFSTRHWPIDGGQWGANVMSYPEIAITGHADGSCKFWDATGTNLQVLYKQRCGKLFEPLQISSNIRERYYKSLKEDDPMSVKGVYLEQTSRFMCVMGNNYVVLFRFNLDEETCEVPVVEITIDFEKVDDDSDKAVSPASPASKKPPQKTSVIPKPKRGEKNWPPGFQAELIMILKENENGDNPGPIRCVTLNSSCGLVVFGTPVGICVVDFIQYQALMAVSTDLVYGEFDPFVRSALKSPPSESSGNQFFAEEPASPRGRCLSEDEGVPETPLTRIQRRIAQSGKQFSGSFDDKSPTGDQNNFSRTSSYSSLTDVVLSEGVTCVAFAKSFPRRNDETLASCMFIGTSVGSVLILTLSNSYPVRVNNVSSSLLHAHGSIVAFGFIDTAGAIITPKETPWKKSKSSKEWNDNYQYLIICSERRIKVFLLPHQYAVYRQRVELGTLARANVVTMKNEACVAAYTTTGTLLVYSLPSLRLLLHVAYDPVGNDLPVRSMCMSNNGLALHLSTPLELQKFTFSAGLYMDLEHMWGTLYEEKQMPEPPKKGFFEALWSGGVASIDREELFGHEASGVGSKSVAKKVSGLDSVTAATQGVAGEVNRTKMLLVERGEKLGEIDEKSERMRMNAEEYAKNTRNLMNRMKDKKWYQL